MYAAIFPGDLRPPLPIPKDMIVVHDLPLVASVDEGPAPGPVETRVAKRIWDACAPSLVPTTLADFESALMRHDPEGSAQKFGIHNGVVYRLSETNIEILRAYKLVALELCKKYGLHTTKVEIYENAMLREFVACYRPETDTIQLVSDEIPYRPIRDARDAILHEIAHALARGTDDGKHGPLWHSIALAIGCTGRVEAEVLPVCLISECKFESCVVFRCEARHEACFARTHKLNTMDILEHCDLRTGVYPIAPCERHGAQYALFPPYGQSLDEYVRDLASDIAYWEDMREDIEASATDSASL